jgi:predicted TIM-barrel fold metal-dependent hydrolase
VTTIDDAHCHLFSTPFFAALGNALGVDPVDAASTAVARLGWQPPGTPEELADRWVAELDRHNVSRAALIASVPGDTASVAIAVGRHPRRFVGFFMVDPTKEEAHTAAAAAVDRDGLRAMCLFPAMHRYSLSDARVRQLFEIASARPGTAMFVHCGVLSIGARKKLGLPSKFDIRLGNPLDLHPLAGDHPDVPIIIPHFGAGLFREALMLADVCANVLLDTSSSNGWMKYASPGLTLADVFRQALSVVGPERLLFGTDSSFFPRGWIADVYQQQSQALEDAGATASAKEKVFGGNFERVFPI